MREVALRSPRRLLLALALAAPFLVACELVNPEVSVQNDLGVPVQIRDISFNGCAWPVVLAPGEATSPCACPPGAERARFKKFDAQSYFNKILEDLARGSHDYPPSSDRVGVQLPTPLWFNYRTTSRHDLGYGGFEVIHIRPDDIEQDFDVPGPYGH
jgi:hypothetical protein